MGVTYNVYRFVFVINRTWSVIVLYSHTGNIYNVKYDLVLLDSSHELHARYDLVVDLIFISPSKALQTSQSCKPDMKYYYMSCADNLYKK